MFVDDEGQEMLAVDLLQKAEGEGFDRLANVLHRAAGVLTQRLSTSDLATSRPPVPPPSLGSNPRTRMMAFCSSPPIELILAISMRLARPAWGRACHQLRGLILRQAHQQHRRFAQVSG